MAPNEKASLDFERPAGSLGLARHYLRMQKAGTLRCGKCGASGTLHVTPKGGECENCWISKRYAQTREDFRRMTGGQKNG